tara:strand:+ start:406 stop:750 length:345 start_codon:yes stop_codon:yes gene_type:complete
MASKKSNATFNISEDFLNKVVSEQDKELRLFLAANPSARLEPKEEGQTFPALRRQSGKRFNISQRICKGGTAKEVLAYARANGGGERDVTAHLVGGFSHSSKFYGKSFITLHAA